MERLAKEIDSLEKALFYKVNSIKLAESRLEARLYRPSSENCRDQPTIGLEKEVLDLRETKACLQNKIDLAKLVCPILLLPGHSQAWERLAASESNYLLNDLSC